MEFGFEDDARYHDKNSKIDKQDKTSWSKKGNVESQRIAL
jgi:hypothetical protein